MEKIYAIYETSREFVDSAEFLGYGHTRKTALLREHVYAQRAKAEEALAALQTKAEEAYRENDPTYRLEVLNVK